MFKKLTLIVVGGAGYVLGAKAGKERYRQIESKVRDIAGMPAVQSATATVKETAADVADTAKATVSEKAAVVADKAKEVKGTSSTATPSPATPSPAPTSPAPTSTAPIDPKPVVTKPAPGPMAGASASPTAPDITRP